MQLTYGVKSLQCSILTVKLKPPSYPMTLHTDTCTRIKLLDRKTPLSGPVNENLLSSDLDSKVDINTSGTGVKLIVSVFF